MSEQSSGVDRRRIFNHGIDEPLRALMRFGVSELVDIHVEYVDRALGWLMAEGFTPSSLVRAGLRTGFARHLQVLAQEATDFVSRNEDEVTVRAESAADMICSMAMLYQVIPRKPNPSGKAAHDAMARLTTASHLVGFYDGLLTMIRLGYLDEVALRGVAQDMAREHGRLSGVARQQKAEAWMDPAREEWRKSGGRRSRTGWAKQYGRRVGIGWRSVYEAIKHEPQPDPKG